MAITCCYRLEYQIIYWIHQIFSLARDWSKRITWPNIPRLKLGNIREYSPIFKTARVAKNIWRIIKTIVSIWLENMHEYLSLDIICSSMLTVFLELRSRKTVRFSEQIMSADKYPCIFSRQMETIAYIYYCLVMQRATSEFSCASASKQVLMQKWVWFAWKWTCGRNTFSCEWFRMKIRFDAEVKGNSKAANCLFVRLKKIHCCKPWCFSKVSVTILRSKKALRDR